jgi:hypothetical protein
MYHDAATSLTFQVLLVVCCCCCLCRVLRLSVLLPVLFLAWCCLCLPALRLCLAVQSL